MWAKNKHPGFTIVELLIVIVVIGILAAITIVAYNGFQTRVENAKTTSVVRAFKNAFITYAIEKGSYPISSTACLGDGYIDLNSNGVADCGTSAGSVTYSKNATLDAALKLYGGTGAPSLKEYSTGTWMQIGLTYEHTSYTVDGVSNPWFITYIIGGTEKCSLGSISRAGVPSLSTTPPAGWDGRSEIWSNGSKCWIPLPNPSTL